MGKVSQQVWIDGAMLDALPVRRAIDIQLFESDSWLLCRLVCTQIPVVVGGDVFLGIFFDLFDCYIHVMPGDELAGATSGIFVQTTKCR